MDMVVKGKVATAQLIKGLWHLFTTSEESRHVLLEKVITIKGTTLKVLDSSPFSDITASEKISIRNLPLLEFLQKYPQLVRKSDIMFSKIKYDYN